MLSPNVNSKEAKRLYREAKLSERAGDLKECAHLNAQALTLDVTASQADWIMLRESPKHFRERRALFRILSVKIDDISSTALNEGKETDQSQSPKIFIYWGQGFDMAPPIVRACLKRTRELHDESDLVLLDDSNLDQWLTLPEHIYKVRQISRAAFADVVRFSLLAKYGGVWLDATCMPTRNVLALLPQLLSGSGFFAFDKPGQAAGLMSNWFLASKPGNYLTVMNREALVLYWAMYDRVVTYFFMHQMFRHMYRLDERFHRLWNKTTRMSDNPRAVNRILTAEFETVDYVAALAQSFVHKLSYKVSSGASDSSVVRMIENTV